MGKKSEGKKSQEKNSHEKNSQEKKPHEKKSPEKKSPEKKLQKITTRMVFAKIAVRWTYIRKKEQPAESNEIS